MATAPESYSSHYKNGNGIDFWGDRSDDDSSGCNSRCNVGCQMSWGGRSSNPSGQSNFRSSLAAAAAAAASVTGTGPSNDDDEDVDAILTSELQGMSLHDRETLFHDMHCVGHHVPEEPDFVAQSLREFDAELKAQVIKRTVTSSSLEQLLESFASTKIDDKDRMSDDSGNNHLTAYQLAEKQNAQYVQDPKLRLLFLRAEKFHISKSVTRFLKFLEEKRYLFGKDKLTKDITLNEIESDPMRNFLLHSGAFTSLPGTDRACRPVFVGRPNNVLEIYKSGVPEYEFPNVLRVFYYMLMSVALRTDCDQTKGAVSIMYFVNASFAKPIFANKKIAARAITGLRSVMPLRMAVVHVCYDEPMWRHIIPIAVAAASRAALPRLIQHYGTHVEIQYKLMSYGIKPNSLPIRPSGENDYKISRYWIETRRSIEQDIGCMGVLHHDSDLGLAPWDGHDELTDESTNEMKPDNDEYQNSLSELLQMPIMDMIDHGVNPGVPELVSSSTNPILTASSNDMMAPSMPFAPGAQTPLPQEAGATGDPSDTLRPGKMDVILGRGKTMHQHPGNVRFRHILEMHKEEYEAAGKYAKTAIAEKILRIIRDSGGRFLQPSTAASGNDSVVGGSASSKAKKKGKSTIAWEEIDHLSARNKVSFTYRTMRASAKKHDG